ncbi:mucin-4-like [Saccostrea echinata]|uniref:mucin-4-like n=1 Tax=Saccostrea echinata TaxID=191078 RepID=UPI002A7FDE23|nr:mucin-4-like [Saccostrea echinata]
MLNGNLRSATLSLTLNELFPFGNDTGDTEMERNDDGSSPGIILSTPFPFFNQQNPKLFVNTNGVISFQKAVSSYSASPFPIANDVGMIAPFWTDINTNNGGTIWYRESVNSTLLDRVSEEVRAYFPQFYRFKASWIFIVTWERVAFYGCNSSPCSKTNTFQTILISNGQNSFTIYNYEQIQWTTGTTADGNAMTGLGGTPAQIGFNAGDGIVFYMLNASRTDDVVNVDEMSNVGLPGKFVFRVDASVITKGGCTTEGNLTITPRYGPLLGGQYLVLSGPCIEDTGNITATFQGSRKYSCERQSKFSMVCITPIFNYTGDVIIRIEIEDQGVKNLFRGLYTVVNPADSEHRVFRQNNSEWFTGQQSISWDPDVTELQQNDTVDIYLFSLVEDNNRHLTWKTQIKGDPHITTFDGFKYTFNGVGEFMLMKTVDGSFQSQIRFEQFRKENGNLVDASICTAFASQDLNSSVVVEVLLNSIRTADVLVNGNVIDFDETNPHHVEGITVSQFTTNSTSVNTTNREFIIAFASFGISFKAIASSSMLNILPVIGNSSLFGNLRGLLGDFDKDSSNDLKSPTGEILHPNSTSEKIYDRFGNQWRIAENESLFTYGSGKSYSDYQKLSFRPTFDLPTNISAEAEELCVGDEECEFDYVLTESAEFAVETWKLSVLFNSSIEASYEIRTCDSLPVIIGGVWNASNTIHVEGSIATLSCCPEYEAQGENYNTTCTNGSWSELRNFLCHLPGSITTKFPIQQIDDFIKEYYKYFIIICVVVVMYSVLIGVFIYR